MVCSKMPTPTQNEDIIGCAPLMLRYRMHTNIPPYNQALKLASEYPMQVYLLSADSSTEFSVSRQIPTIEMTVDVTVTLVSVSFKIIAAIIEHQRGFKLLTRILLPTDINLSAYNIHRLLIVPMNARIQITQNKSDLYLKMFKGTF